MEKDSVLPPGQHPLDPSKPDIDPLGFALARVRVNLVWIDEHLASYKHSRNSCPDDAERELAYLENSIEDALAGALRLSELLLAGYGIDPNKRLPKELTERETFLRLYLDRRREAKTGSAYTGESSSLCSIPNTQAPDES